MTLPLASSDTRYRSVSVDGARAGCYRLYQAPVNMDQLLGQPRHQQPFVVLYQPAARRVFTSPYLLADREVVAVLPGAIGPVDQVVPPDGRCSARRFSCRRMPA